jgi:hypothetical protein
MSYNSDVWRQIEKSGHQEKIEHKYMVRAMRLSVVLLYESRKRKKT